jgi:hypothetical protein
MVSYIDGSRVRTFVDAVIFDISPLKVMKAASEVVRVSSLFISSRNIIFESIVNSKYELIVDLGIHSSNETDRAFCSKLRQNP